MSNFEICSLVIKIAIDFIEAELLAFGIPIPGLFNDNVENDKVDPGPINFSVITKKKFDF